MQTNLSFQDEAGDDLFQDALLRLGGRWPALEAEMFSASFVTQVASAYGQLLSVWPDGVGPQESLALLSGDIAGHLRSMAGRFSVDTFGLSLSSQADFLDGKLPFLLLYDLKRGQRLSVTEGAALFAPERALWVGYAPLDEVETEKFLARQRKEAMAPVCEDVLVQLQNWEKGFAHSLAAAQAEAFLSMESQTALFGLLKQGRGFRGVLVAAQGKTATVRKRQDAKIEIRKMRAALVKQASNGSLPEGVRAVLRLALKGFDKVSGEKPMPWKLKEPRQEKAGKKGVSLIAPQGKVETRAGRFPLKRQAAVSTLSSKRSSAPSVFRAARQVRGAAVAPSKVRFERSLQSVFKSVPSRLGAIGKKEGTTALEKQRPVSGVRAFFVERAAMGKGQPPDRAPVPIHQDSAVRARSLKVEPKKKPALPQAEGQIKKPAFHQEEARVRVNPNPNPNPKAVVPLQGAAAVRQERGIAKEAPSLQARQEKRGAGQAQAKREVPNIGVLRSAERKERKIEIAQSAEKREESKNVQTAFKKTKTEVTCRHGFAGGCPLRALGAEIAPEGKQATAAPISKESAIEVKKEAAQEKVLAGGGGSVSPATSGKPEVGKIEVSTETSEVKPLQKEWKAANTEVTCIHGIKGFCPLCAMGAEIRNEGPQTPEKKTGASASTVKPEIK